jgi:hypothetical protein
VPELIDMADITQRISQERIIQLMNLQVLGNKKIPTVIRRRLYQAIVVNIALRESESWALKEENRAKLETFHHSCLDRICGWGNEGNGRLLLEIDQRGGRELSPII